MQESYHKLTTMERQLLFKVFRQSSFYNFVNFLTHLEEIYKKTMKQRYEINSRRCLRAIQQVEIIRKSTKK